MQLQFIELLSADGGFADVWRARDELDRDLAVKIVRDASIGISNALQHARALARAKHPNVVVVHAIEKVQDPTTARLVDAVVMELLPGQTLSERLQGPPLTTVELRTIGAGVIAAVRHIHSQGMVHGDLHEQNVMVCEGQPKVIDLLHRYSLAMVTEKRRDEQILRELRQLKGLLQQLFGHSELGHHPRHVFTEALHGAISIEGVAKAFCEAVAGEPPLLLRLEHPPTPLNLFDLIVPGLHRERVRSLLGAPSFWEGERWIFRYRETQAEIGFDQHESVESVVLALCHGMKYYGTHPTGHTDQPFGELTLADLLSDTLAVGEVGYRDSLRTREIYVTGRWGPSGAWSYFSCGSLDVLSRVGLLAHVEFEWDHDANRLKSDPANSLINWMAATASFQSEAPGFNWLIK